VITLVLGGAASGKSEFAERLAARAGEPVTYLATWPADPTDTDMMARVARHRARRPASWRLVEPGPDLAAVVAGLRGTVLLDGLGTWVAASEGFAADGPALVSALVGREGHTVVVSDEVGLGVHPSTEAGRRFRDALGAVNKAVSAAAGAVWLVVAGRVAPVLSWESACGA